MDFAKQLLDSPNMRRRIVNLPYALQTLATLCCSKVLGPDVFAPGVLSLFRLEFSPHCQFFKEGSKREA